MSVKTVLIEVVRILIAVAVLAGAYAGFQALGGPPKPPEREATEASAELVETVAAEVNKSGLDIDVDGVAAPYREINVAAEVAGRIVQKMEQCRAGKFVKKGEMLLQLDDRDYQLEVNRLEKEISQALSSLDESDVETRNSEALIQLADEDVALQNREVERVKSLAARNAASPADVDQVQRARIAAQNVLTQLQNQLRLQKSRRARLEAAAELKKVQLERATLDLRRTKVEAPISGVIVSAAAEEDAFVQRGAPLMTIEDTSRVEIQCRLKMGELALLWGNDSESSAAVEKNDSLVDYEIPPAAATIIYQLGNREFRWEGRLARFEGIGLDSRTRTMPCRVVVPNPRAVRSEDGSSGVSPPALVRGMFVNVRIHVAAQEPLLQLPELAVRPGDRVWVNEGGKLRIVSVDIVRMKNSIALVRTHEKLKAGGRVVVSPLVAPREGMLLRDVNDTDSAESETASGPDASENKDVEESA